MSRAYSVSTVLNTLRSSKSRRATRFPFSANGANSTYFHESRSHGPYSPQRHAGQACSKLPVEARFRRMRMNDGKTLAPQNSIKVAKRDQIGQRFHFARHRHWDMPDVSCFNACNLGTGCGNACDFITSFYQAFQLVQQKNLNRNRNRSKMCDFELAIVNSFSSVPTTIGTLEHSINSSSSCALGIDVHPILWRMLSGFR